MDVSNLKFLEKRFNSNSVNELCCAITLSKGESKHDNFFDFFLSLFMRMALCKQSGSLKYKQNKTKSPADDLAGSAVGTSYTYECLDGYKPSSDSLVTTCLITGNWSLQTPECEESKYMY